jgi:hypothetical protein
MRDAGREPGWGQIGWVFTDAQVRAAISVPIDLARRPIGTLDLYADDQPRDWDHSVLSALQAYAGVVASLLAAAPAPGQGPPGRPAPGGPQDPGAAGAGQGDLMVRHETDEATAFERLRLTARSSGRTMPVVAQEVLAPRVDPHAEWRLGGPQVSPLRRPNDRQPVRTSKVLLVHCINDRIDATASSHWTEQAPLPRTCWHRSKQPICCGNRW